jgi:nucleoside-diphosphate-sugar epimerase
MYIKIKDLAELIAKSAGTDVSYKEPSLSELGERSHIMRQVLCSKKLESLGWKSSFTIEEGVRHILRMKVGAKCND